MEISNLHAGLGGVGARLLFDLGHEPELGRVGQGHVEAEARHHQDQALGDGERPHVVGRRGPGDADLETAGLAELLPDGQVVGQDLARVVDIACMESTGIEASRATSLR